MSSAPSDRWAVTYSHVRAVLVAATSTLLAVLLRRPDLLVLATPLVVVVVWSVLTRPRRTPQRRLVLGTDTVTEGAWVPGSVRVERVPGTDVVATRLQPSPYLQARPPHGANAIPVGPGDAGLRVPLRVRPTRWGRRTVGPVRVGAVSPWGAFRWGPVAVEPARLRALPDPAAFDARAAAPHPRGLVGRHRSARPGEGSEFASIRPFQWGDRLRRVHWGRSLRTGELHVTASHADQDTHVALLVDGHYDLGAAGGVDGAASTLDHSVRAAAAVAEHFLHRGDRVSLQVLSARTPVRVPPGTGRRHGRRILHALAAVVPSPQEQVDSRRLRRHLGPGSLVVLISALVSPDVLTQGAVLSRSGLSVVVVDVLVEDVRPPGEQDTVAELAWRIRLVERDREIRRIQGSGVPVVPWRGPGSLDQVLRSLARRRA